MDLENKTVSAMQAEIELLMDYGVPKEHRDAAGQLVGKYAADPIALNLFHEFYSYLPEAMEDAVRILRLLARRQGVYLLCASTLATDYLYAASVENAVFLGPLTQGIWDDEVLDYFGFASRDDFIAGHRDPALFPVYVPTALDPELCLFCAVASGECHIFGCPAEVCPWCGGQLTRCNCRFSQLDQWQLDREGHVDTLLTRLIEKGRIPYEPCQRPTYPTLDEEGE